jgi:hypothetical protein
MTADVIAHLRATGRTVHTRADWGARQESVYQWRRTNRAFYGPADHFFAHITVTARSGDFKRDCRDVEQIGQSRFGSGVSYNWLIDRVTGHIAEGQPLDAAGTHTLNDKKVPGFPSNLNYWGHAIAWIGRPEDPISADALESYAAIIAAEKATGHAKAGARLHPHSKFAWKDCPCDQVRDQIPAIEARAAALTQEDVMNKDQERKLDEVLATVQLLERMNRRKLERVNKRLMRANKLLRGFRKADDASREG